MPPFKTTFSYNDVGACSLRNIQLEIKKKSTSGGRPASRLRVPMRGEGVLFSFLYFLLHEQVLFL